MSQILKSFMGFIRVVQGVAVGGLLFTISLSQAALADDSPVRKVGLGSIHLTSEKSLFGGMPQTPDPTYETKEMRAQATPTNQWYSSVIFTHWSEPIHAHPATYKAGPDGFEVGYPVETPTPEDHASRIDIVFPHRAALTLSSVNFTPEDARLAGHGDFSATISMGDKSGNALLATVVHGSPFSYYTLTTGDLKVHLAKGSVSCGAQNDDQILCVHVLNRDFAVFVPADSHWVSRETENPVLQFGASGRFFSVAVLPDNKPETIAVFRKHAYAFIVNTNVDWHYDQALSRVKTIFTAQVESKAEGQDVPILGLYPHQARATDADLSHAFNYQSVRGPIRAISSAHFSMTNTYHGILPFWGGMQDAADRERLSSVLVGDAAKARNLFTNQYGSGTYWYGKALSATAQLMCVAEQEGKSEMRDSLLKSLEGRLEAWFKGDGSSQFIQDARIGTVVGSSDEYGSITHINDHHFHYGYWVNAAAQVALRDPEWAKKNHWGGMVDLLVSDIATSERGRNDFPFVRNFDSYEGHSWASGDAAFTEGNNQESSSEAINAWAGLILWAEATGDNKLRDLGIWLYTTETEAVTDYWFDMRGVLFPPAFGHVVAAQVFGGRYSYNTWWTEEPRQIQGINLMPITPASVYLARDPAYIRRFTAALTPEKKAYNDRGMSDGTPDDIWQDIFASFLALGDPDAGLAQWKPRGSNELGETRSHTLNWLLNLKEMGTPDFSVTADTTLFGVFHTVSGQRTYMAYNSGDTAREVHFSDGKVLNVAARSLGRSK